MNKRTFAKTVIGAIVGVSAIPEFGKKPAMNLVKITFTNPPWHPILHPVALFPVTDFENWKPYIMSDCA